jgi:hypothetical protein
MSWARTSTTSPTNSGSDRATRTSCPGGTNTVPCLKTRHRCAQAGRPGRASPRVAVATARPLPAPCRRTTASQLAYPGLRTPAQDIEQVRMKPAFCCRLPAGAIATADRLRAIYAPCARRNDGDTGDHIGGPFFCRLFCAHPGIAGEHLALDGQRDVCS